MEGGNCGTLVVFEQLYSIKPKYIRLSTSSASIMELFIAQLKQEEEAK